MSANPQSIDDFMRGRVKPPSVELPPVDDFMASRQSPTPSAAFDIKQVQSDLNSAYRSRFGKDIRVTSEGQDAYHRSRGLNHQGKIDVGLGQETPEQREFVADWLRTNRIPHKIFTRAMPGTPISGPHAHIGSGNGEVDFKPYGGAATTSAARIRGAQPASVPRYPGSSAPSVPLRPVRAPLSTLSSPVTTPEVSPATVIPTTPAELPAEMQAPALPVAAPVVDDKREHQRRAHEARTRLQQATRRANSIKRQPTVNPEFGGLLAPAAARQQEIEYAQVIREQEAARQALAGLKRPDTQGQGQSVPVGGREQAQAQASVGLSAEDQALRDSQLAQMRGQNRVLRPISEGAQGSAGSTLVQLGNALDILDRYSGQYHLVPGLAEKIGEARDYLRNKGRAVSGTAGISAQETDAEAKGLLDSIATSALRMGGSLPLELSKIGLVPGGPVTKFGTLGALSEDDASLSSLARGGTKGAAVGAAFGVGSKLGLIPGAAAVGASTYGIERAFGASDEEAKRAAITNVAFHALGYLPKSIAFRKGDKTEVRAVTYDREGQPLLGGEVEAKPDIEVEYNAKTGVYEPQLLREAPRQLNAAPEAEAPTPRTARPPIQPLAPSGAGTSVESPRVSATQSPVESTVPSVSVPAPAIERYEHLDRGGQVASRTEIRPLDERGYQAARQSGALLNYPENFEEFQRSNPTDTHYTVTQGRAYARPTITQIGSLDELRPVSHARRVDDFEQSPSATVIRVRHSNPEIDGDVVVGKTSDGRLRVQGEDGVEHTVRNPRTTGNREATIVRERPTPEQQRAAKMFVPREADTPAIKEQGQAATPLTNDYNKAVSNPVERDTFRQKYSAVRFGTVNAVERRMDPRIPPQFKTTSDGDFFAFRVGDKFRVYPRLGLTLEPVGFGAGALGKAFDIQGMRASKNSVTGEQTPIGDFNHNEFHVSRPAVFTESDGKWQLEARGQIVLPGSAAAPDLAPSKEKEASPDETLNPTAATPSANLPASEGAAQIASSTPDTAQSTAPPQSRAAESRAVEPTLDKSVLVRQTLVRPAVFNSLPAEKRQRIAELIDEFKKSGYIDASMVLPDQQRRTSDRQRGRMQDTALRVFAIEDEIKQLLKPEAQVQKETTERELSKLDSRKGQLERQKRDLQSMFAQQLESPRPNKYKNTLALVEKELSEVTGKQASLRAPALTESPAQSQGRQTSGAMTAAQPKPAPEDFIISRARYAKNSIALRAPSENGYKSRAARLAEALGGRWSNRESSYIMPATREARYRDLYEKGYDGHPFTGKLEAPKAEEPIKSAAGVTGKVNDVPSGRPHVIDASPEFLERRALGKESGAKYEKAARGQQARLDSETSKAQKWLEGQRGEVTEDDLLAQFSVTPQIAQSLILDRKGEVRAASRIALKDKEGPLRSARVDELTKSSPQEIIRGMNWETQGNQIKLNAEAYVVARGALDAMQTARTGKSFAGFSGAFLTPDQVRSLVPALKKFGGVYGRAGSKAYELANEISRASRKDGTVTLLSDIGARLHEEHHRGSFLSARLGGDVSLRGRHASFDALVRSSTFKKLVDALRPDYPHASDAEMVEEASAHIAEAIEGGDFSHLNVSLEEGVRWYSNWLESLAKRNGVETARQFEEVARESTRIREQIQAAFGQVEGAGQALRDSEAGRARSTSEVRQTAPARKSEIQPTRQVDQTRTPEFEKWFADSKVVDRWGGPLIVYHGTTAKAFNIFNTDNEGAHFGTRAQAESRSDRNGGRGGRRKAIAAYLKIENPLRLPDLGVWGNFDNVRSYLSVNNIITDAEADSTWNAWQQSDKAGWDALKAALAAHGYDGIVYENEVEGRGDSYIALRPTQIKSATGNRGTFSPTDPNILRSAERKGEAGFLNVGEIAAATKRNAVDLLNAPRSLMSSFDLSAPLRQGAILTLTEPKASVAAMKGMFQALVSTGKYNAIGSAIATDPDFTLSEDAGLYLSMIQQAKAKAAQATYKASVAVAQASGAPLPHRPLSVREESFMSEIAEKIPHVKYSEQAYVAYLDLQRFQAFKKYARELRKAGLNPTANAGEFKDIAKFINAATGRGDLGKTLNSAAPVLNAMFFSPRYLASRLNLLNPVTYARMNPVARKIAMRKMLEFAALVGLTLLLAKLGGAEVEWDDPESPDWLKIKVGNTRYDFLAGFQQPMRFIYRMTKRLYNTMAGKAKVKDDKGHIVNKQDEGRWGGYNASGSSAFDVGTQFARSKLSPTASFVADWAKGTSFDGQPFSVKRALIERVTPMVGKDFYEAYKDQGAKGAAKATPSILGVGVQTYKPSERKPKQVTPVVGLPPLPRPRLGLPKP